MALDVNTVVELVRARIGVPDASANVRIIWSIPHALERLARKVAAHPRKRPLLTTKRDDEIIEPLDADGLIDLTDVEARILIEFLDYGELWFTGAAVPDASGAKNVPMQRISPSQAQAYASHPMRGSYVFFTIEGTTLRALPFTGSDTLAGDVTFCVPYVPLLEELDGIPELHDEFIDKVLELVLSPESDAAMDGER